MNEPTPDATPHKPLHLSVLPTGRVEQLRSQIMADRVAEDSPPSVAVVPATPEMKVAPPVLPLDPSRAIHRKLLEGKVIEAISTVFDPEIPVNVYELGLIYDIDVKDDDLVHVKMTLTAPGCPVAGTLPVEVEKKIEAIPEVKGATVELVWEPQWDRAMMSEVAMLQLGF